MKKIIFVIVILALIMLMSCNNKKETDNLNITKTYLKHSVDSLKTLKKEAIIIDVDSLPFKLDIYDGYVFEFDSCEYVLLSNTMGLKGKGYLAHKGNCKYCAEREKKMIREVVKELLEK